MSSVKMTLLWNIIETIKPSLKKIYHQNKNSWETLKSPRKDYRINSSQYHPIKVLLLAHRSAGILPAACTLKPWGMLHNLVFLTLFINMVLIAT